MSNQMNDLNSMDKVSRAVRARIELGQLKPEHCSYSTYSLLKLQADQLWNELTNTEQAEARVLLKYKGITV